VRFCGARIFRSGNEDSGVSEQYLESAEAVWSCLKLAINCLRIWGEVMKRVV